MITREQIISEINVLDESELPLIAEFVAFIKSKNKKIKKFTNSKDHDSIFDLGRSPVEIGISDASENLDRYLY